MLVQHDRIVPGANNVTFSEFDESARGGHDGRYDQAKILYVKSTAAKEKERQSRYPNYFSATKGTMIREDNDKRVPCLKGAVCVGEDEECCEDELRMSDDGCKNDA